MVTRCLFGDGDERRERGGAPPRPGQRPPGVVAGCHAQSGVRCDRQARPDAIIWTHANEVNQALLDFIGHPGRAGTRQSRPENAPQRRSENGRAPPLAATA